MSKLKLTGFGRFVLFLIVVAPIVYFGVKYLKESGLLVIEKEQVEEPTTRDEQSSSGSILDEIDRSAQNNNASNKDAIIAEQQRRIEELERQNQELQKRNGSTTSDRPPANNSNTANTADGAPSIDELIKKAEERNGRSKGTTTETPTAVETLAQWRFTFSGVKGLIEFYQQNNRLMSKATYEGINRIDIYELIQRDNKFYVRDSPTDEYYVLREDGNLDAYDNSGFQTTCVRTN